MPKLAKELQPVEIGRLSHTSKGKAPVFVAVGGISGLMLQITPSNAKSWVLRYTSPTALDRSGNPARRKAGLGSYPETTLARARELAREARDAIRTGRDPIQEREDVKSAAIAASKMRLSFADATERYLNAKVGEFSNAKHRQQWASTLRNYAVPEIGNMPCDEVGVADVLRVIGPIWETKTETAQRLRGRIEKVLSWARVNGHRTGENPARWQGNLSETLKKPSSIKPVQHQPMVAFGDLPAWFADLSGRDGIATKAMMFAALTAARSGEVRGATWSQINLAQKNWTRPAELMKMKREHTVALSAPAIALLEAMPRFEGSDLVFPAPRGGMLSDMALSAVMRRIHAAKGDGGYIDPKSQRPAVPHGLRASFKTWTNDCTSYPRELTEYALAHQVGNDVERAYSRGEALERRRGMMDQWADVLSGKVALGIDGAKVVAIRG